MCALCHLPCAAPAGSGDSNLRRSRITSSMVNLAGAGNNYNQASYSNSPLGRSSDAFGMPEIFLCLREGVEMMKILKYAARYNGLLLNNKKQIQFKHNCVWLSCYFFFKTTLFYLV